MASLMPVGLVSGEVLTWFDPSLSKRGKVLGQGVYGDVCEYVVPADSLCASVYPSHAYDVPPGEASSPVRLSDDYAHAVEPMPVREARPRRVAVKRSRLDRDVDLGVSSSMLREICLLSSLEHPNVVRLLDAFVLGGQTVLVMPCAHTTLDARIDARPGHDAHLAFASLGEKKDACAQLLEAVGYLQSLCVLHGDLKPSNVLVYFEEGGARYALADFGLARRAASMPGSRGARHEYFSLWYRAPELLMGGSYGPEADAWALGCIIVEVLTGRAPFRGDSSLQILQAIVFTLGTPTDESWPGVRAYPQFPTQLAPEPKKALGSLGPFKHLGESELDLARRLLELDPKRRLRPGYALEHPWFEAHRPRYPRHRAHATGRPRLAGPTGRILTVPLVRRMNARVWFEEDVEERGLFASDRVRALATHLCDGYLAGGCSRALSASSSPSSSDPMLASSGLIPSCSVDSSDEVSPPMREERPEDAIVEPPVLAAKEVRDVLEACTFVAATVLDEYYFDARTALAEQVSSILVHHGASGLVMTTSHDLLEATLAAHQDGSATKGELWARDAARTLLTCSYHTRVAEEHDASAVARLCYELGCSFGGLSPHASIVGADRASTESALRVLGADLAELWVCGVAGERRLDPASARDRERCERGLIKVDEVLLRVPVLAEVLGLSSMSPTDVELVER